LIHHFLENSAEKYPEKIALIHEDIRESYADINNSANSLAHWLIDQNIHISDRVVILLENSLEYVVSYYGILKAGAVAVPLSCDLKPEGLEPLLVELEPKAIIASKKSERLLKATDQTLIQNSKLIIQNCASILDSSKTKITTWDDIVKLTNHNNPVVEIDTQSLASIIYTSGSTGKPKGVMLSHGNIVANTNSICSYLALKDTDIQMVILPFFYVMGKSLLNTHFAVGGTVVINNKFAFPAAVLNQMIEEKVTGFSGVPSTYAYLLHRSPLKSYKDKLTSLRYCTQAGGHMAKPIKEELRGALPVHTQLFIMFGATEASARLSYLDPSYLEKKIDSIGKPIPGVTLKILDQEGRAVESGQKGEIVANGKNIMQGYWKDSESTRKVLDNNGYHTGDTGYQDADGFFYIEGRKDELLKVGGHRINPQEIEDALLSTGLVMEASVIGVDDILLGKKLVGLVALKANSCNTSKLLSLCSEKLPKYKLPSTITIVKSLPKNSNGKIDKIKCQEMAISL
jgi:acyl-CoA synthetase (AMP-forming)/AMP-acid ligase II